MHRSITISRSVLLLATTLLVACSQATAPTRASLSPATPTAAPQQSPTTVSTPTVAPVLSAARDESRIPFPPPASCRAAAMNHGEVRRNFPAYWYDGDGIALGNATAVFYQHDNKVMWQVTGDARPTITGERVDGAAPPMEVQNLGLTPSGFISGVVFPAPGCWHLRATAAPYDLDATFYVYPSGCIPATMRDPSEAITPCVAPNTP